MKAILKTILLTLLPGLCFAGWAGADKKTPDEAVYIPTPQGDQIKAYLWLPEDHSYNNQYKAVVMAHGCGGAHYKNEPEKWTAKYISGKYKVWGKLLNEQNIIVLMVDSFTTRDNDGDIGGGVCQIQYSNRPDSIDPVSVRPADIAAGISYLKSRSDILTDDIGVLGFSNGGSSALALAGHQKLEENAFQLQEEGKVWFDVPFEQQYQARTIVALYPGCGLNGYSDATQSLFTDFTSYTDTFLFAASDDNSLPDDTPEKCSALRQSDAAKDYTGSNMMLKVVPGTGHQFDYKENDEPAVQKAINSILNLFVTM